MGTSIEVVSHASMRMNTSIFSKCEYENEYYSILSILCSLPSLRANKLHRIFYKTFWITKDLKLLFLFFIINIAPGNNDPYLETFCEESNELNLRDKKIVKFFFYKKSINKFRLTLVHI
jgi:hypothetical protein